jgi:N-acetylglucosamine kinase-like BadF-type ATPase
LESVISRLDLGEDPGEFALRVMKHLNIEDVEGLIEWVYNDFQPSKIASLAYAVGQWASEGSELARHFIVAAGHTLRHAVLRIQYQLQMPDNAPVYLLGGLWNIGEILKTSFQFGTSIASLPALSNICPPKHDAAYGAALLPLLQP